VIGMWKNFDLAQVESILRVPLRIGEDTLALTCPVCGSMTLHWYAYASPFRSKARVAYVWCSNCRHYHGATGYVDSWVLPDPLAPASADERLAFESDLEAFFGKLDRLWSSGQLPQIRLRP